MKFNTKPEKSKEKKQKRLTQQKRKSLMVRDLYYLLGKDKRAEKVHNCCSHIEYKINPNTNDKTLHTMFTCQNRFCPVCSYFDSKEKAKTLTAVINKALASNKYEILMTTFTIKNVPDELLKPTLDKMIKCYSEMMRKNKILSQVVLGWYRGFEITWNKVDGSWHPHIHALWLVDRNYFKEGYITQQEIAQIWQKKLHTEYTPHVWVRKADRNSARELAKYVTKDDVYLNKDDFIGSAHRLEVLSDALFNRNLQTYAGVLKKIKAEIEEEKKQGNIENSDDTENLIIEKYRYNYKTFEYELYLIKHPPICIYGSDGEIVGFHEYTRVDSINAPPPA